ncbi:MAG: flagellar FliJ family protein [Calditerrivibrio sp.]|nr:flagellar FliJ family protein [Calditerrivibrio sp.]
MDRKFKLQKILEYREKVFELEKQKLIELQNRLKDYRFKRESLSKEIEIKRKDVDLFSTEGNFDMIVMANRYLDRLYGMLQNLNNMIESLKKDIEKQKEKVISAMNDVKIMEKLKEKHNINYIAYLKKEEMKLIDDLVITRSGNES